MQGGLDAVFKCLMVDEDEPRRSMHGADELQAGAAHIINQLAQSQTGLTQLQKATVTLSSSCDGGGGGNGGTSVLHVLQKLLAQLKAGNYAGPPPKDAQAATTTTTIRPAGQFREQARYSHKLR